LLPLGEQHGRDDAHIGDDQQGEQAPLHGAPCTAVKLLEQFQIHESHTYARTHMHARTHAHTHTRTYTRTHYKEAPLLGAPYTVVKLPEQFQIHEIKDIQACLRVNIITSAFLYISVVNNIAFFYIVNMLPYLITVAYCRTLLLGFCQHTAIYTHHAGMSIDVTLCMNVCTGREIDNTSDICH
jgi:hypothetical protein